MRISNADRNLDRDIQSSAAVPSPVEAMRPCLSSSTEAHMKPGCCWRHIFNMCFDRSGGIPNPTRSGGLSRIGDAAVFGLTRTAKILARLRLSTDEACGFCGSDRGS